VLFNSFLLSEDSGVHNNRKDGKRNDERRTRKDELKAIAFNFRVHRISQIGAAAMMGGYILAIDQGTTGTKVLIFDYDVNIKARAYSEFTHYYPTPG
jgi:activator of 2-hydroxyglutaryl-CoA dehydratase